MVIKGKHFRFWFLRGPLMLSFEYLGPKRKFSVFWNLLLDEPTRKLPRYTRPSVYRPITIAHPDGSVSTRLICSSCGTEYPSTSAPAPCSWCDVMKESGVRITQPWNPSWGENPTGVPEILLFGRVWSEWGYAIRLSGRNTAGEEFVNYFREDDDKTPDLYAHRFEKKHDAERKAKELYSQRIQLYPSMKHVNAFVVPYPDKGEIAEYDLYLSSTGAGTRGELLLGWTGKEDGIGLKRRKAAGICPQDEQKETGWLRAVKSEDDGSGDA